MVFLRTQTVWASYRPHRENITLCLRFRQPQWQIEYTTSATASAIPTVVNASGQVTVKHPPRLSTRSAPDSPSPYLAICSPVSISSVG